MKKIRRERGFIQRNIAVVNGCSVSFVNSRNLLDDGHDEKSRIGEYLSK